MKTLRSFALALGALCGASGASALASSGPTQDIVQTAISTPGFSTLVSLVQQADLVTTLQGPGPFTVFAPTDAAFAALDPNLTAFLTDPQNVDTLRSVLLYHVVADEVPSAQVLTSTFLPTVNGQRAYIRGGGGQVTIANAVISVTDVICSNGIIHVLDGVMQPNLNKIAETAAPTGRFDTLLAAVGAANLANLLDGPGPFTILAPTDLAFAALPPGLVESLLQPQNQATLQAILAYHVIPSRVYADQALAAGAAGTANGAEVFFSVVNGVPRVNGARILRRDIDTANGVIHAIDRVLLPPLL